MCMQRIREYPRDMDGLPAGAVLDLVPAAGAVRDDNNILSCRADRRQNGNSSFPE